MNGGTFTPGLEKERAGMYFRFTSAAKNLLTSGDRGIVALPIPLSWGPSKTWIEIREVGDIPKKLGLEPNDPSLLLLREAKKKCQTVLLYRPNSGTKATGQLTTGVTATAKFGGVKGNDIRIQISDNVLDASKKDVTTFFGNKQVDRQTVATAADLKSNAWCDFTGTEALVNSAGISLTGGTDDTPTNADYMDSFAESENEYFDVFALPVSGDGTEELQTSFVSFVKRLRDQQGIKIRGVVANHNADYEGVTNVTNGVIVEGGRALSIAETVAWVAGASAAATVNQSLTFVEYEGAIDVQPRYDHDEIITRLANGEFMFTYDGRNRTVSVESDINSLVTLTEEKNKKFQRNKFIRTIDAIHNGLRKEIKDLIKERKEQGQDIPASVDGVQIIRTASTLFMNTLQEGGAIQNFDAQTDLMISLTQAGDGFNINVGVEDIQSAEKYYFGVEVR